MALYALYRLPDKFKISGSPSLRRWSPLFGVLALLAVIVILMNPEFFALGLFGDTAFFDFLVLAISCQMQGWVIRAVHYAFNECAPILRFLERRLYQDYVIVTTLPLWILWAATEILPRLRKVTRRASS